jgi:hypothetical protein
MRKNLRIYSVLLLITVSLLVIWSNEDSLWRETLIGLFSALILLICIEIRDFVYDRRDFGYLAGKYKRVSFSNVNKRAEVDTKYQEVANYTHSQMELVYKGQGEYEIPDIAYEEGRVRATIFLDKVNKHFGAGTYQYKKFTTATLRVDIGTYTLYVNQLDRKRLYLFHQNILPSGLSHGYEEWIKIQ